MSISVFTKRHPVLIYFIITFAISWGGFLLVMGPGGFPCAKEQFETLFPIACVTMVAGPSVAGILLTGLVYGKVGFREFLSRLISWRVGARWYAVALLTAPFLIATMFFALSLLSPLFLAGIVAAENKVSHLLMGLSIGLVAGIFEELGWTGFAILRLRLRYSILTTGLIMGIIWAAWHLLATFWASGTVPGTLSLASYLLDPFLFLVLFRVLMVWVYDRTGSLLVAMLMHFSLTASARIFDPLVISGIPLLTFDLIWAATLLLVVVVLAKSGRFSRQMLNSNNTLTPS